MTTPYPRNEDDNAIPHSETNTFEPVRSAYQSWGTPSPTPDAPGAPVWTSWDSGPPPSGAVPAKKQKKTVGLGTALGLMLVGSVAAGSIVGVATTQFGSDSSGAGAYNSLEQPS